MLITKEAAEVLGVSVRRIQAMAKSGRLPARKVGRDWHIDRSYIEKVRDRRPGRPRKGGKTNDAHPLNR